MVELFQRHVLVCQGLQYLGAENVLETLAFTGKAEQFHDWFVNEDMYRKYVAMDPRQRFKLFTSRGTLAALPGDWLVKTEAGVINIFTPEEFERLYEVVE